MSYSPTWDAVFKGPKALGEWGRMMVGRTLRIGQACLIGAWLLGGHHALAQETALEPADAEKEKVQVKPLTLEVIVVTTSKRETQLLDTAAAVSVLSGDRLVRRGIASFNDLVNEVPGLAISSDFGGAANLKISLRGVGGTDETRPNGSPSVAFHVDDVFQTTTLFLAAPLFDVDRLEVLKGPQGTLYGRNTTAGVVNVITRGPGDEFEGFFRGEGASFGRFQAEGAIGGPVTDRLGLRVAAFYESGGGFQDTIGAGPFAGATPIPGVIPGIEDPGAREGFGDADLFAARATMDFAITENASLTVKLWGARDRGEVQQLDTLMAPEGVLLGPDFAADIDNDPFTFLTGEFHEQAVDIFALAADYEAVLAPNLNLDVILGYQSGSRELSANGVGSPARVFNFDFSDNFSQTSVEARISDDQGGAFDWIFGAFYLRDQVEFFTDFQAAEQLLTDFESDYVQSRESFAAFAQFDVPVTQRLTLSGGLRYTFDEGDFSGATEDVNPFGTSFFFLLPMDGNPLVFDTDTQEDNLSGRVTAKYDITDTLNVFVSYGTGYKAGGFDGSTIFTLEEAQPFDSETVAAIELGLKWFSASGLFDATLDLFRYNFEELQSTTLSPNGSNIRTNVAAAELQGLEFAAGARVLETAAHTVRVTGSLTWLGSEITEFDSADPVLTELNLGNDLPGAPRLTANFSVDHIYGFANGWFFNTIIDARFQGDEFKRLTNDFTSLVESYFLLNGRIELDLNNGLTLYGFARNMADAEYFLDTAGAIRLVGPPRTVGGGLIFNF